MNKKRRALLNSAVGLLENASSIIEGVMDDEQDSYDNMPENLQESENCRKMEDAIDGLQDAIDYIGNAIDKVMDSSV